MNRSDRDRADLIDRRWLRLALVAFAGLLPARNVAPVEAAAMQQPAPSLESLRTGDRIRLVAPPLFPDPATVTFTELGPEALRFDRRRSRGGPGEVPLSDLTRLEVSVEWHRQTAQGLGIGTLVGLGIGGLATWAFCGDSDTVCNFGEGVATTLIVAAPFAALGGLFGYLSREDMWEEVEYQ